jgi:hypothetical protein
MKLCRLNRPMQVQLAAIGFRLSVFNFSWQALIDNRQ